MDRAVILPAPESAASLLEERGPPPSAIITPYIPAAFQAYIDRFGLGHKYPFLVQKLRTGFRLGDLHPLSESFTPPNHPSASKHASIIRDYLHAEREKGHMSGPYTKDELESLLGAPFRSSPIQVVEKFSPEGELIKARMAINLSYKDASGVSVNDMINSDDTPTRWGKASDVEHIVSVDFPSPGASMGSLPDLHGHPSWASGSS